MKPKALGSAIKKIVWAEVALTAALGTTGTLAQAQSAAPTNGATAAAPANDGEKTTPPSSVSGTGANTKVQKLERFEVTGSLIRSADKVGFNQVQTFKAADIANSGYTNVADFLRGTSANSASSWSEGQSNGFASGGAGIALRGLSEKYTLVMVDGQRVAPYGFASNGTDTFFDLNTLPLNIIDRIEIVKTGAVSQYGSDAIAGVVNIITKRNYRGLELDASYGGATQSGQGTTKFSVLGGFGDLNADRFNVTAAASYYKANGFTLADRDTTKNEDFTGKPGGLSEQSPLYWETGGAFQALNPCPFGSTAKPTSGNAGTFTSTGTICSLNTAEGVSIAPWTERLSVKVHADFKLSDSMQAFADIWESRNKTDQNNGYAGFGDNTSSYNPATGGVNPISNVVPASNPYNPFGAPTALVYTFPAATSTETTSNFWRFATGVKGTFTLPKAGDWNWTAAYSHSQSTVDNTYTNVLNVPALESIINNGGFNFANPSATPNGLNGLFMSADNQAISKLDSVDLTASTPNLFHLPTGDIGFGLGAQFLHESEYIGQSSVFASGIGEPAIIQSVDGSRNVAAAYYQIDIPIIRNLTFSHSGRYDHYSDFGGAFSPRFALRYQPVKALTMYASYNRGFRAPTLIENTASKTFGVQSATDHNPISPLAGVPTLYEEVQSGNTHLQPERTKNYNIGFELSPTRYTDIGLDWYKIHIDHVIGTANIQNIVNGDDPSQVVRAPNGAISYVNLPYQNLGFLDTDGFESTFRQSLPTSIGTFTLSGDWAWVHHFKMPVTGLGTQDFAGNDGAMLQPFGASFPRWKGNTQLSWDYHKWDASLSWVYTGPYKISPTVLPPGTFPGQPEGVASYSVFNFFMTYTGFKHWTLYAGVDNIFNRAPPFDPFWQNVTGIQSTGYDQSLYMYYGRFAQIGATYKF